VTQEPEYHDAMTDMLELVWGRDFMAPGGEGNVDNLVWGLDVRNRRVLDIGCGLGGPAFVLAEKYGAEVVGIDIDPRLVEHAERRAGDRGLSDRATFETVEPGPLPIEDGAFDFILISGAMTQIEDKHAFLTECLRVLRPGGWFTCYDWMRSEYEDGEEFSEDMLYWFELEGLTYAMASPSRQLSILREVGFEDAEVEDRSPWYRREARNEYVRLRDSLYPRLCELMSKQDVDQFVEGWRAMVVVCEKGEMLQVYSRGRKPARKGA
jgi:phosphoethanolamine N-methyltransferase